MIKQQTAIKVFTDGACKANGKANALSSIGVYFPQKQFKKVGLKLDGDHHTNQRAELSAIIFALKITGQTEEDRQKLIKVYTDSQYCCWIAKWPDTKLADKNLKNRDLVEQFFEVRKGRKYLFIHVRGHRKFTVDSPKFEKFCIRGNNKADQLATAALKDDLSVLAELSDDETFDSDSE